MAASLFTIWIAPSPLLVGIAYLAFSTVAFAVSMLISSAWAEALHVRELAIGAAAINTLSQIGAFVTPFAWGAAKDATGMAAGKREAMRELMGSTEYQELILK
jgi:ACS family tartrate transporter-like MFS transporter